MSAAADAITWAETALEMVEAIPDRRIRAQIVLRVRELTRAPAALGKPLAGELTGLRSVRAVGQRHRIIHRVERRLVTVLVVAVVRRKEGDRVDIYELGPSPPAQRLADG